MMRTCAATPLSLLTADDFLDIDFGERKAELDNGVIRMMPGGTAQHAEVGGNIFVALANWLRGSGCKPYNSDMATDPRVLVEVLSVGPARTDLRVKLDEYKTLPSVDTIVFVDIATERVRIVQRTGPHGWSDVAHDAPMDVPLPALGIILPHDEMFARD